jgi:2-polyprenyl-6-methoxyphenol hydroxylase-like FAD-dependent oxidoreductase
VVVGADGIHSSVRQQVSPGAAPLEGEQVAVRGIARGPVPSERMGVSGEFWGPGVRFGLAAIAPAETYWWCALDRDLLGDPVTPGPRVRALVGDFPDEVARAVENTPDDELIVTPLSELPPLPTWWRGRAVLLGDAAHAMTPNLGQGGAQAMEDAWVLADRLATHGDAVERAFAEYEEIRRRRAEAMTRASRWTGRLAHLSHPVGRRLRDAVLRLTPRWVDDRQARGMYHVSL